MESEGISFIAIGATIIVSVLTVFATDFFGLRRDKARLRMEFAWQLRRQRWDALYGALQTCPRFVSEPTRMLQSISELTEWSATKVEPWIGSDRVSELRSKREDIEGWLIATVQSIQNCPEASVDVPSEDINSFRDLANQHLTDALQRIRSDYSPLLKDQKF